MNILITLFTLGVCAVLILYFYVQYFVRYLQLKKKHLRIIGKYLLIMLLCYLFVVYLLFANSSKLIKINTDNAKIVHGLTILTADNKILKFDSIEAPDLVDECLDAKGNPSKCIEVATEYLSELMKNKNVNCQLIRKDAKDIHFVECYDSDRSINIDLVANGLVNTKAEKYLGAQRRAQENHLGIWRYVEF